MEEIKLDEKKLQQMAEQYALKGAEKAIMDFYTGYNSLFMKEVQRQLSEKMETNLFFDLPQMTAAINQALSEKVTEMANTVVANTFLPMLNRLFSQERKTVVTTQDLFEHFGDAMREDLYDDFDPDRLELRIETRGFTSIVGAEHRDLIFCYGDDAKFELHLMSCGYPGGRKMDENGQELYMITSLPGCSQYRHDSYPKERQMRIRMDGGATLEMPFVPDVLRDEFMRYVAGLLLCNTPVTISRYHEYHLDEDLRQDV